MAKRILAIYDIASTHIVDQRIVLDAELVLEEGQGSVELEALVPRLDCTHHVVDGELVEYTEEEIRTRDEPIAWSKLRVGRNQRLSEIDAMNPFRVSTLSTEEYAECAAYRQALLDLPANTADPFNPTWPTRPACLGDE